MTDSDAVKSADEPEYSYVTATDVRFADFDPLGHVNNAVYSSYLELARIRYMDDVVDISLVDYQPAESDHGIVVANTDIDFQVPIDELGEVSIALATVRLGTSSFTIEYEIRFQNSVVLTAETTQVVIDTDTGQPTPIPDDWRQRIVEYEGHF